MPSAADDCWRLSADCSHWAEESRDNAARLAFRQMATAWAGLAFSQDFILPTDEQVDATGCESSQATPAENTASSHTENEKIVPVRNAEVDAERHEQTTRASTTTRRGNVNGYLYHHPPRSLSGEIRRAHQLRTTIGQPPPEELAPDDERNCRRCIITAGAAARPPRSTATTAKRNRIFRPSILRFQAPSLDDALSTLDDLYSWTVSDRAAITCC